MSLADCLSEAEDIARRAGTLALHCLGRCGDFNIEAKLSRQDTVSEAHREVETLIRRALARVFPADAQLGEEHGLRPGTSGLIWVIDPIDGTAPFLAGQPAWCISIGLLDAKGPVIGVIRAPIVNEMFVARRGHCATLNGKRTRIDAEALDLRSGLLDVDASNRAPSEKVGRMMADPMDTGVSWVRYASGAVMLAWFTVGRLLGYAEPRMSAWGCIAGYCLIDGRRGRPHPQVTDRPRPDAPRPR
ncbi:inositol monophosphatase family protein [Jannaschia rubra]|uniref:inositol monophosphatase family protein n=1 Tax=Jannaschia rubra TaxID=282197 RepID=UPI00248FD8F0|nr:inositol monophosphatase family protein [Jannaschia rubra]